MAGSCQFISFVGFASSSRPHSPTAHSMSEKPLIKHVDIFAHMWPPKLFFKKTKIHHDNINMDSLDSAVHIDTYRTYHVKSQISYIYMYVYYHITSNHLMSNHIISLHIISFQFHLHHVKTIKSQTYHPFHSTKKITLLPLSAPGCSERHNFFAPWDLGTSSIIYPPPKTNISPKILMVGR